MKNKITDTSLFAELVKDRHKREVELKRLLEPEVEPMAIDRVDSIPVPDEVEPQIDLTNVPLPSR